MIKIKHAFIDKAFAFFVTIFIVIALIGAFLLRKTIFVVGLFISLLTVFFLWMIIGSEIVLDDDILVYKFGPFVFHRMPLDTIRTVISYNNAEHQCVEIVSKDNKSIEINTGLKKADRLLDYIGRYDTERDLNIIWIER